MPSFPFQIWVSVDASGKPSLSLSDPSLPAPSPAPAAVKHRGVNLTGGDTSWRTWSSAGPVLGTNYQFISRAEIDLLLAAGMRTFRVLFSWEALQPAEYAVLTTLSGASGIYRDELFKTVAYLRSKGAEVLLDMHGGEDANFAAYKGVRVGSRTVSGQLVEDLLANVWRQLAAYYDKDPGTMFGITNEPHDIPAVTWFAAAQKVIDAIRATGSNSKIVMPGVDWTSAASWGKQNANAWNLRDPASNLAVQVHLYFNSDGSGTTNDVASVDTGPMALAGVTAWCRARGLKLWVAETGLSASHPLAAEAWKRTLAFIDANADVVEGLLWWATGPASWWGNYRYALIGADGKPTAQMRMIVDAGTFR